MAHTASSFTSHVSDYHDEQWKHVRHSLKEVSKNSDEVSIHHTRVEIKKLEALYEFLDYCDGRGGHRTLHPLRKLFKLLGRLRDHSNALGFCLMFKIDSTIFDSDRHKLKGVTKKIKAHFKKHKDDLRRIEYTSAKRCRHTDTRLWRSFMHEIREGTAHTLAAAPSEEELHAARKSIKHMLYIRELPGANAKDAISAAEIARLDTLQDQIGAWHDLLVFRDRLLDIGYDKMDPAKYTAVDRRVKKLRKEILKGR